MPPPRITTGISSFLGRLDVACDTASGSASTGAGTAQRRSPSSAPLAWSSRMRRMRLKRELVNSSIVTAPRL